jgi:hypothetical protein
VGCYLGMKPSSTGHKTPVFNINYFRPKIRAKPRQLVSLTPG